MTSEETSKDNQAMSSRVAVDIADVQGNQVSCI